MDVNERRFSPAAPFLSPTPGLIQVKLLCTWWHGGWGWGLKGGGGGSALSIPEANTSFPKDKLLSKFQFPHLRSGKAHPFCTHWSAGAASGTHRDHPSMSLSYVFEGTRTAWVTGSGFMATAQHLWTLRAGR